LSTEQFVAGTGAPERPLIDMVLALVPDAAVVVDADGEIIAINENLGGLFGYRADELTGQRIEVLVPERFRHGHRGLRTGYLADPKVRAMGAGLDLYGRRRDGTEFPVDISLAPVHTAGRVLVVAAIRDVTERRATEAAHAQLAAIVRTSLDAILATTVDGRISSWNPAAERTFGFTGDEILGQHVSRLVPTDQSELFEEQLDGARRNQHLSPADTEWLTCTGERLPVAVSVSAVVDSGSHVTGFSFLVRDITQRKQSEAELRRLLQASENQARWQQVSAEIRLDLLAGQPLDAVLQLIAERMVELVAATAVVVVRDTDLVVAACGAPEDLVGRRVHPPAVSAETIAVLPGEDLEPPLRALYAGRAVRVAAVVNSSGDAVTILCDPGPDVAGLDPDRVVASFAEQAVLLMELHRARDDRERVMLSDERERIARDLHDHAVQSLFATGLSLQAVIPMVGNARAAERMNEAVESIDATIKQIRTAIFTLSAPAAAGSTLRADIVRLGAEAGRGLGFEPAVAFDGPVDAGVRPEVAAEIVAVVREALANVARHAQAQRVSVEIEVTADECGVVVTDDGVGIPDAGRGPGNGLTNLRARADRLGGTFSVSAPPNGGTRLDWRVPLT
jgi:PAS domain S-box-containing protein